MTAWLAAHVWGALVVAFLLGVAAAAAVALRLGGGPEDPSAEAERRRWMGHWP